MALHPDEVDISAKTARQLIVEQFPEWHQEDIEQLETDGTVNAIYRIGTAHTARFPLHAAFPRQLAEELRGGVTARSISHVRIIGRLSVPSALTRILHDPELFPSLWKRQHQPPIMPPGLSL